MKNLVEELQWRGLYHDAMPGTSAQLLKEATTAYIGFDPTADSLHIGSMVQIILLCHLRNFGHKPVALVGGATGMIGDPSGKSDERNLLNEEQLAKNVAGIKRVLSRFLDFDSTDENAPLMVNNYDWMKDFTFIDFAREVGKRITVNYMMAKDSVKKRLSGEGEGMSFTEFTYQLIQGYDFYHLHKHYNCVLQMGGSDQWGNITTGTELVRRMNPNTDAKAFALTTPLITKTDGSKFGKSEGGNIWLDADKTSVYKFYQFWLNTTDVDAEKYIKIFTFLDREFIEDKINQHREQAHLKMLQRLLAEQVTEFVHGKEELEKAIVASNILFYGTTDDLKTLDEKTFLEIFEGVPKAQISTTDLKKGLNIVTVLNEKTQFLKSNREARQALAENSISVNKGKVSEDFKLTANDLINDQFVLLQRGKKNYFIVSLKRKVANAILRPNVQTPKSIIKDRKTSKNTYRLKIARFRDEEKYQRIFDNVDFLLLPNNVKIKVSSTVTQIHFENEKTNKKLNIPITFSNEIFAASGTIPMTSSLRKKLGLKLRDEVEICILGNKLFISKALKSQHH